MIREAPRQPWETGADPSRLWQLRAKPCKQRDLESAS